ncbi:MAG TPA: glycosyltransferase family 39 protein [Candidatus Limnocylindrales bacterium]|nr:glycosyltransferase family 39 protein [Candidatus Limnocylindrales bacterium]
MADAGLLNDGFPADPSMASRSRELWRRMTATPAIPMTIALLLGLYAIDAKSFWFDEGFSVGMSRLPTEQLLERMQNFEMQFSPYYLALHAWFALGESEAVIRGLSVAFGVIGVAATFYVGRRYGVAFAAALILAVSSMLIEYEQEARGYTMLVAGSAVSTLLFLRLLERPGRLRALLYFLAGAALIYVFPLGALVVVAHGLWLVVDARDLPRALRARIGLIFPAIAVAWIPMLLFALTHPQIQWMTPTTLEDVTAAALHLSGGWILLALIVVMLATGMRRDLPALWLLVPLIGTIAITLLIQPVHQARYFIAILPPAAIILARNPRIAVVGLVALSLATVSAVYSERPKADWRSAAAYVASEVQPGDGIVFAPSFIRTTFGYYAHVGDPLFAASPWKRSDLTGGPPDIPGILARERIWLVRNDRPEMPDSVRNALATFSVAETRDFYKGKVLVDLLVKPPL